MDILNWLESKSIRLSRVSVITVVKIIPSVMTNTESEMILRLYNPFDRWDDINPKLNVGNPDPGYKDILNKFLFVSIGVTCSE